MAAWRFLLKISPSSTARRAILGYADAKLAKENLMTCADVPKIQESGRIGKASVYANAFGTNLPKRRASDRPVFKAMASFGVGDETTNAADGLLVYGKDDSRLQADFERLVAVDPVYGATAEFQGAQDAYLEGHVGARLEGGYNEFLEMLEAQRRRLYFSLPEFEPGYPRWSMTAFRFAGDYLDIIESLKTKKPVSESTRGRIARGINRVMTGLLLENIDRIFIASSGGFTQGRVSVLCDHETPSRRQGGVGMAIKLDERTGRPLLDVSLSPGPGNSVKAASSDFPDAERVKLMRERFQWPSIDGGDDEDYSGESPEALVSKLVELALARHKQHVGKIHALWSKAIGLSSRRLSRRTRYAPNDRLLKSIVVTIVHDRMQFDEFLAEVRKRYGLVIGDAEGERLAVLRTV